MTTEVILRDAPVVVGISVVRIQSDCLVIIQNGFLMTPEVVLRVTPIVVGFGQIRLQPDCLVVVRDGFLMTTEVILRDAPVAVGFRVGRIQPNCLVIVRDSILMTTEVILRVTPVVVGIFVVWIQPDCLVIVLDGFLMTTEVILRDAPVVVGFRVDRIQSDCLVIIRDSFLITTEVVLRVTSVIVGIVVVWIQPDCLVIIRDSFLITTEVVLRATPIVVGIGVVWIQPDCLIVRIYYCFRNVFAVFLSEITDGKPSPSRTILVTFLRDNGHRTPLLDGFLNDSLLLKLNCGGNNSINRGRIRVLLNARRNPAGFVRVVVDVLSCKFCNGRFGLIAQILDLLHISARFGLDFTECLKAEIAGDDRNDTEQRQEDSRGSKPPINSLCPIIQQFASELAETTRNFDIGGGVFLQHRALPSSEIRAGHATLSTCLAASRRRISPEMSLGSSVSRRVARVRDS